MALQRPRSIHLPNTYEVSYILRDGSRRTFTTYGFNKLDAGADAESVFRMQTTSAEREGARCFGCELVHKGGWIRPSLPRGWQAVDTSVAEE